MDELEIREKQEQFGSILIDRFKTLVQLFDNIESNKRLEEYKKITGVICDKMKKEMINDFEINNFICYGEPISGFQYLRGIYGEHFLPGIYMLFPSEEFKSELDKKWAEIDEILTEGYHFWEKVREQYNYVPGK